MAELKFQPFTAVPPGSRFGYAPSVCAGCGRTATAPEWWDRLSLAGFLPHQRPEVCPLCVRDLPLCERLAAAAVAADPFRVGEPYERPPQPGQGGLPWKYRNE